MFFGFRAKIFLAIFGVAVACLLLVATLVSLSLPEQTYQRIERSLVSEAHLIADVLALHERDLGPDAIEAEAAHFAKTLPARVTFVAADGTVAGDSMVSASGLAGLENHGTRPEVLQAKATGTGISRRYSHTVGTDMLYVAVPVSHPRIAFARLALPLTEVQEQISSVRHLTLVALAVALTGAAALAWLASFLLGRRLHAIAAAAQRVASGDLSQRVRDYERDELGTVARVLDDTVRDLAGRAAELSQDRARTDAILAGMVEGVMVITSQGRVRLVNRAARAILGLDESADGVHYLEMVRVPAIARLLTEALADGQPAALEFTPPKSPDRRVLARAAAVSAPSANGAVLVLHDITDLRRADQMRRDFVANVSHELRTPLTAIRGYVEALTDEPAASDEQRTFLDVIARHAHRMERLVRDLLRLAALDARQEPAESTDTPLQPLLAGAVADLGAAIEARRQVVHVTVHPGVAVILTDPAKLQDVVRNLVENAVNYSPEGRRIDVDARPESGGCLITVADEGPGIPEQDLERVFERFYRVDKARSRESGGTGLGLSIVKHLVQLLGGRVWAANRPEGGARFSVTLPRTEKRLSLAPAGNSP
jgi:two-component system, OmpR family, phosphate regulon sensor histidine kinase PhoR